MSKNNTSCSPIQLYSPLIWIHHQLFKYWQLPSLLTHFCHAKSQAHIASDVRVTDVGGSRGRPLRSNMFARPTLQGTNISHLGKRNIIFKMPFLGDMLVPWRVSRLNKIKRLHVKRNVKSRPVPLVPGPGFVPCCWGLTGDARKWDEWGNGSWLCWPHRPAPYHFGQLVDKAP